jgi:CheY-like chemotaxis protein
MPGKNGYEVAQYVKRSPRLAHIPVVLLTGAFEPVDQARAAEAGCDGVLAKPFEPQLVIGRVRELLTKPKEVTSPDEDPALPADLGAEWASPGLEAAVRTEATPDGAPTSAAPADIGDYFDRLDAAFANLSTDSAPAPAPPPEAEPASAARPAAASAADEVDWFTSRVANRAPEPDLPLLYAAPEPVIDLAPPPPAPHSEPVVSVPMVEAVAPAAPEFAAAPAAPSPLEDLPTGWKRDDSVHVEPPGLDMPSRRIELPRTRVELPPLSDAFAALLAAEQRDPSAAAASAWPAAAQSADALVEEVTRRVMEQLSARSDGVVRETVADLVSAIAERLVREEIERIKASIK